jgi:hypothetical protein
MNVERLLQIPPNLLKLGEKQRIFTWNLHHLIEWTYKAGYELTLAEAYRTPEQAALNAKSGAGISNSLHTRRLAIDLMLFKDGEWLKDPDDYKPLGTFWKTLHPLNRHGGDFKSKDAVHFSMEDGGIK